MVKSLFRLFVAVALVATTVSICFADANTKATEEKRLRNSGEVLGEIMNIPDDVPQDLMNKARCVIVIPSVIKAAFGIGGSYGRGAMVCRTGHNFSGSWGAPSMMVLEAGSIGFQIGGQATDYVLLVMNNRGASSLLHSKVKLGAGVSVAAGPVGRSAAASTDAYMRAEVLTYSRSRGAFAGVSLSGATLHPDNEGNEALYGHKVSAEDIVFNRAVQTPEAGEQLDHILQKASPHEVAEAH
ncbi:MAG TPA: lipid-binding SYLF domain-containing protein [Candidatus Acidoferrales bacterium]|nr:lipid-binding SYLF domain-containing protein [Candidatus Acidoferrales bacterium]